MNPKKQKWLKHGDYAETSPCYKRSSSEFAQHLSPSIHTAGLTRGSNDRRFIRHQHMTRPSGHSVLRASQWSSIALLPARHRWGNKAQGFKRRRAGHLQQGNALSRHTRTAGKSFSSASARNKIKNPTWWMLEQSLIVATLWRLVQLGVPFWLTVYVKTCLEYFGLF